MDRTSADRRALAEDFTTLNRAIRALRDAPIEVPHEPDGFERACRMFARALGLGTRRWMLAPEKDGR